MSNLNNLCDMGVRLTLTNRCFIDKLRCWLESLVKKKIIIIIEKRLRVIV